MDHLALAGVLVNAAKSADDGIRWQADIVALAKISSQIVMLTCMHRSWRCVRLRPHLMSPGRWNKYNILLHQGDRAALAGGFRGGREAGAAAALRGHLAGHPAGCVQPAPRHPAGAHAPVPGCLGLLSVVLSGKPSCYREARLCCWALSHAGSSLNRPVRGNS